MNKVAKKKTKNPGKKKKTVAAKVTKVTNQGEKMNTKHDKKMHVTDEGQSAVKNNGGAPVTDVSCILCEVF
jgi:hypothetical protein